MFECPSCGSKKIEEGKPCPSCGKLIASFRDSSTIIQSIDDPFASLSGVTASGPVLGSMFASRYRIEELLGRGGMGSVYRVFDTVDQEPRALKILHSAFAEEGGADRFRREIEILSKIQHPGVPRIFDWGEEAGQLYFVAEYIEGRDLKTEMRKHPVWSPDEVAQLGAAVADALSVAHQMKVVHRDVKPQNIMIADDGSVRLLDFGVARAQGQGMQTLTKTGMILGTPEYMSPEQFGSHKVEPPSDVYSLGIVLYEMATGQLPFSGHPMNIAMKIMTEPVPPPRTINREIPHWLDRIIMKCLQRDLKIRYPSAQELAADLRHIRESGRPKMNWLPGGDAVVEDLAGTAECDLVLSSSKEKTGWEEGIGLHFGDMLYKLNEIIPPDVKMRRWFYCFSYWPQEEVARQVIDYQTDRMHRDSK